MTARSSRASYGPDFDQTDLVFIQVALTAVIDSSRAVSPELYHRYLTMFLDGIRTDRDTFTPLTAAALTANQTHVAMTRQRQRGRAEPNSKQQENHMTKTEKMVWLITGAGRGMGTDIAKAALAAGHAVVATGRDPERVDRCCRRPR